MREFQLVSGKYKRRRPKRIEMKPHEPYNDPEAVSDHEWSMLMMQAGSAMFTADPRSVLMLDSALM